MKSDLLYPLKFEPILKERLWGGTKLGDLLGKTIEGDLIGESWEISGVPGNVSVVANGLLKGKNLQELIDRYSYDLMGEEVYTRFGNEFPILIKFIDAQKDLSIQLHPGDELASKRHGSFGKTEMWYIMKAEADSKLIIGFNRDVLPEEYKQSLKNNSLLELLNYESVKEGDAFLINSGKIHAIGAGIMLAEIQQTSDITYRIYDFNRRDKDGKMRELHTDEAVDAIDYLKKTDYKINYDHIQGAANDMVSSPYFTTKYLPLFENTEIDLSNRSSFSIYLCLKGSATMTNYGGSVSLSIGETVLIPANTSTLEIQTVGVRLLEVTI